MARTTSRAAATWAPSPTGCPGFQHVENDELRAKFDAEWGVAVPPKRGWHLSGMFDAMERGDLTAVYCIGENPVQSEADQKRAIHLLEGLDFLVVQDLFLTKTAELADVVLPATAAWAESEGHRHQLRAPRPARPQGGRAARRGPRRPGDHLRPGEPHGRRLGRRRTRRPSGTRSAGSPRSTPG